MDQEQQDNNQKKTDVRDNILRSALRLFAKQGYFNTSLTDIKDAAGVKTTSAIYQHFKNKQAIASTLYADILDSLSCSIDDIRRRNRNVEQQLREIVDLFFGLAEAAPEVMRFILMMKIDEFLPGEKPLHATAPFQKMLQIIQTGIKAGKIRGNDPQLVYAQFFGIINQILIMQLTGVLEQGGGNYQTKAWMAAWNSIARN